MELVDEADRNKDGKIDFEEWKIMGTLFSSLSCAYSHASAVAGIKQRIPMAEDHVSKVSHVGTLFMPYMNE